jgi:glycosyltransferase involved in cell wall biosynthesis
MTVRATVVIPTHDHGSLLSRSIASACAQTIQDIEILVIGDGVPETVRDAVEGAVASDARVRLIDHPKGPRLGEKYRHQVLAAARGKIVCYLCDDDLWLDHHIEVMDALLQSSDVAHALPVWVTPEGRIDVFPGDLADPRYRRELYQGQNFIPLSCFAHTMEAYRRLPEGWRTTPDSIPTDLYMYQQFLAQSWCRAVSGWEPTVLHFPSPDRLDWTVERRGNELDAFSSRLADLRWRRAYYAECIGLEGSDRARLQKDGDEDRAELARVKQELQGMAAQLAALVRDHNAIGAELARVRAENADLHRDRDHIV